MSPDAPPTGPVAPRTILTPGAVVTRADWPAEQRVRAVHVVRIGGAGMSAVARLALEAGLSVSGSESQEGQFLDPLRADGAVIHLGFDGARVPEGTDLLVVSTAVRADNPEVLAARERGIPVVHRAAALAGLLAGRILVAVAGTHGKTSTTGLAVSALRGAGIDPAWAVGAAVPDLGRNAGFAADPAAGPAPADGSGGLAVVEADESDGSFLAFAPRALVVTNLEADHLDFHGDEATLVAGFDAVADRVVPGGALVVCAEDAGARALGERAAARGLRVVEYGAADGVAWRVLASEPSATGTRVRLATPGGELDLDLSVAGHHNVLNAVGALAGAAVAVPAADPAALAQGLGTFRGASRRFEVAGQAGGVTVVDDYAHHPREVAATLDAARGIVDGQDRGGRVLAVFQPHLYSRTRAFAAEFAAALAAADRAWVLPVYGAREDPVPGIDARTVTDRAPGLQPLGDPEDVAAAVADAARAGDLVLMLGAGDVVELTPAVLAALAEAAPADREAPGPGGEDS